MSTVAEQVERFKKSAILYTQQKVEKYYTQFQMSRLRKAPYHSLMIAYSFLAFNPKAYVSQGLAPEPLTTFINLPLLQNKNRELNARPRTHLIHPPSTSVFVEKRSYQKRSLQRAWRKHEAQQACGRSWREYVAYKQAEEDKRRKEQEYTLDLETLLDASNLGMKLC